MEWEANPGDYHTITQGISSSFINNMHEGTQIGMPNTQATNQTMPLLPMLEILVSHYSNYGRINSDTRNRLLGQYPDVLQRSHSHILIKGLPIMEKDSNLMVHIYSLSPIWHPDIKVKHRSI
jgi:hypothetical protein